MSTNPRALRWWVPPIPDTPPVCPQVFCCPYCSFLSPESEQVRAHALSQHAVQPTFRCPLCQEQLVGRPALHFHLSHLHNVVPECVERLLLVVSSGAGASSFVAGCAEGSGSVGI